MWNLESVAIVLSREQRDYENTPMQYAEIFKAAKLKKIIIRLFLIFFSFLLKTWIVGTR